jgi:hypothetical protein
MDTRRWERVGAASGIVSVVLVLVGFFSVPTPPKLNELSKTMAYLGEHRTGVLVQAYLFTLATGFLLWFAGSVRTHLRRNEDGSTRLSDIAFGGAIVGAAMLALCSVMLATAAFRADAAPIGDNIRLMTDLGSIAFAMAGVPFAVFVGATAIVSYRSGAFPIVHAAAGAVLTVALGATPLLMFRDTGFFSLNDPFNGLAVILFAFMAWELATSVLLIVGEAAETQAEGRIIPHEHWHLRRVVGQ